MKSEEEKFVICRDKQGTEHKVLKEDLSFRIAVCGLLTKDNSVYLIKDSTTDKWELPGGAVEKGESLESTLRREFLEETGINVKVDRFATYKESFYYMRNPDVAYQTLRLFFFVSPLGEQETEYGSYVGINQLNADNTSELSYQALRELFLYS